MSSHTLTYQWTNLTVVDDSPWDELIVQKSRTLLQSFGFSDVVSAALSSMGSDVVLSNATTLDFPSDEVSAIEFMVAVLGVTQSEVLKAVGVPKRTFHGWKSSGHTPRESAKARIWTMTNTVAGLAAVHENLTVWYHSNHAAMRAFKSGDASALALADISWAGEYLEVQLPPVVQYSDDGMSSGATGTAMSESEDLEETAFPSGRATA